MIDNKLKQKIFIESYNSLSKLPKDKRTDKGVINRIVSENYVKYCEWDMARSIVNINQTVGSALGLYGVMSKGAKWLWHKIKGDPQLDQRTKAVIAQKMIASAKDKLATKDVITRDELLQIMQDSFNEKEQTKNMSESWFSSKPKVDMTKYAKEIFDKFGSMFSSKKGKFCSNIVTKALNSKSPDKVLSTAIVSNAKKKDSNYLSSWLETARFVYDYSRKLKKSTSYCVLAYMLAIACCAFQIPARFLYPFANGEELNVQKKDIWVKYLSKTSSSLLLFNFILYVYVLCITPSVVLSILSGEFLPILILVTFNVLFHYREEIFPEKTESYVNRLSLEWL